MNAAFFCIDIIFINTMPIKIYMDKKLTYMLIK